jgi:GNAT superfamily N-acetyltransferase
MRLGRLADETPFWMPNAHRVWCLWRVWSIIKCVAPMDLTDALLPISEIDVRDTYSASGASPVALAQTTVSFQVAAGERDGTKVIYFVTFFIDTGEPLLDKDLERWLCMNRKLLGQVGRGRVAVRVKFYVRSSYRGKGFAPYIVEREEELFRGWGAQEIQMPAMELGRWVWTRAKFGYSIPQFDFDTLQQSYRDWQRSEGTGQSARASSLSDFPREFLLSSAVSTIQLFKSL